MIVTVLAGDLTTPLTIMEDKLMPEDFTQFASIDRIDLLTNIFCRKPTVRILFYTDDFGVTTDNSSAFGTGKLRNLILNNNPFYVNFQIDLLNRHNGGHAFNKLTAALLATYDQIWFFGISQANVPGAPENELTTAEVTALRTWMNTGGVLMTGDHANPKPFGAAAGLDPLVNLGRAIGFKVPRAGQLRKWEGDPSSIAPDHNHNTQVPVPPGNLANIDTLGPQQDAIPQLLNLKTYPLGFFPWFYRRRPHPIFCGRRGPIEIFPDHMHEGQLLIPSPLNAEWPSSGGFQPGPEVIAWGTDKRNGSVYPVVSAYDGDDVLVGRIVADATWHHYFNINLVGFPVNADGTPGPVLAQIANFYVNLAVWLSPRNKRTAMRCSILWYLATHPQVLEVKYNHLYVLGGTAYDVLGRRASQCEMSQFLVLDIPRLIKRKFPVPPIPPEELILGGIIEQYHQAFDGAQQGKKPMEVEQLISRGLQRSFDVHINDLQENLNLTREGMQLLAERPYKKESKPTTAAGRKGTKKGARKGRK